MKILLSALLGFISMNAFAVHPTQGPLQQHPALCNYGYNPNCGQASPPPPQKIIKYVDIYVPDKYGALAGEPKTGILRDFANADSLAEAKRKALDLCSQGGKIKGCRIYKWVRNGCISAAGGRLNGGLKLFEAADVPGKAESAAMKRCQAVGTSNCRIVVPEVCSVPEGMYQ